MPKELSEEETKALKLKKCKVKQGRLVPVYNKDRKFGANMWYYALWIENHDGKDERCLLFTEGELEGPAERAKKNIEDLPKKGWLTDLLD